jgi:Cd2+/Zn2+-exporting ATPase
MIPGKGAEGDIGGRRFWIGSHRFMEEKGAETPEYHQLAEEMEDAGHSLVALGDDSHICGLIGVADEVRPDAAEAIEELRAMGIGDLVMLTGDNNRTAAAVADSLGLSDFAAELLPQDKVEAVSRLRQKVGSVAMVGDGVNDAPALAAASLGIAMGAAGSDAAIETADIALMSDDLTRLPWLIRHARRTLRIIRQNIFFALAVKAVFIVLAALGLATLWMAIAADMGASLLVIANALRLLR